MTTNLINNLKIYLIENVFHQFELTIKDLPPLFPQVQIHTFQGIDNQLVFLFNKNIGQIKQKEVLIKQEDRQLFQEIRIQQGISDDEQIEFGGDDLIKKYQIFKTTVAPKNYESFSDANLIEQSTIIDQRDMTKRAGSASYLDKIKPNTKYYYTFRCIDIHDQISNPSVVYQVEIINENGTIFPLIEEYKFPEREDYQESKDVKRLLMIKTDDLQEYMTIKDSTDLTKEEFFNHKEEKINLGIKENSPYGKIYKLRMVSKNTNKIYDFKFTVGKTIKKIE